MLFQATSLTLKALVGRFAPGTTWTPATGEVHELRQLDALLDFNLLLPTWVPTGYELLGSERVPGARDLATLLFRAGRGEDSGVLRLSERLTLLPVEAELNLARVPSCRIRFRRKTFHLVEGGPVGEPIDPGFWHRTRASIAWEESHAEQRIACELRFVVGRAPSLGALLRMAQSVRRLDEVSSPPVP
jgi:hypothetical protein